MPGITVCDKCKEAHWSDVKCPKCFPEKVYTETEVQKIREQYESEMADKDAIIAQIFTVKVDGHLQCPFCGCSVDPKGWMSGDGETGPECVECGATAQSIEIWDNRFNIKEIKMEE